MQVFPFPSTLSQVELELLKTAFERFELSALAAGFRMFRGEFLQVGAHQAGERRIALDGDLADLLHQFLVDGEGNVHKPIIRETLSMGNWNLAPYQDGGNGGKWGKWRE